MKKINPIYAIVYGLIGLFLVSTLFLLFSLAYSSLETMSIKGLDAKAREFKAQEKEFLKLEATFNEWHDMEQIFSKFKKDYLIRFDDYPAFRNELQGIFGRNFLQEIKSSHKYRNMFSDIRRVSIDLQIKGAYTDLKKFISEIESKAEMIVFDSLNLVRQESGDRVLAKIIMEVYFVK